MTRPPNRRRIIVASTAAVAILTALAVAVTLPGHRSSRPQRGVGEPFSRLLAGHIAAPAAGGAARGASGGNTPGTGSGAGAPAAKSGRHRIALASPPGVSVGVNGPYRAGTGNAIGTGPFFVDTTAIDGDDCEGIVLGQAFYQTSAPADAGQKCQKPTQAYVLFLKDADLTCLTTTFGGSCASFYPLQSGSHISDDLQTRLTQAMSTAATLTIVVGPPGAASGDPRLSDKGFSYVFHLKTGKLADLSDPSLSVANAGLDIGDPSTYAPYPSGSAGPTGTTPRSARTGSGGASVAQDLNPAGELRGWLQSASGAAAATYQYAFVSSDSPMYTTQQAVTTVVSSTNVAPKDQLVAVLVTSEAAKLPPVALEVPASSKAGDPLGAGLETDLPAQRWLFTTVGGGSYRIVNVSTGLCLDLPGGSLGAPVDQQACTAANKNQQWTPSQQDGGDFYTLASAVNPVYVLGPNAQGNLGVGTVGSTPTPHQRWRLATMTAELLENAVGMLTTAGDQALDLVSGSMAHEQSGTLATVAAETDVTTQQWLTLATGIPNTPQGLVFVNVRTSRCLTVPSKNSGAQLTESDCAGNFDDPAQVWTPKLNPDGETYLIQNVLSQLFLSALPSATQAPQILGEASQAWTFRPLARTLTMQVGGQRFYADLPVTWSGFVGLGVDSTLSAVADPFVWYTNTGNPAASASVVMGSLGGMSVGVGYLARQPGGLVFVQSVNSPKPTNPQWATIANGIDAVGGIPEVFNAMNGTGDYALVGCSGCTAAQASVTTGRPDQDHLAGLLHRNAQSGFEPALNNSLDSGTGTYDMAPVAYAPPTPWAAPAGVNPTRVAAVLPDVAHGLGFTTDWSHSCYVPQLGEPDVRSSYCNTQVAWESKRDALVELQPPGNVADCSTTPSTTTLPNLSYSAFDWCAMKAQLRTEFDDVSQVQKMMTGFSNMVQDATSSVLTTVKTQVDYIRGQLTGSASADVGGNTVDFVANSLAFVASFGGEVAAPVLGGLSALIFMIDAATGSPNGSVDGADFKLSPDDQLQTNINNEFTAASDRFGIVFNMLVQDPVKLATAAANAANRWGSDSSTGTAVRNALVAGVNSELYRSMIPAYYTRFSTQLPAGKSLADLPCNHGDSTQAPYYPLSREPSDAVLLPVLGINANGSASQPFYWFLASGSWPQWNVKGTGLTLPGAGLTGHLFGPATAGDLTKGVGLNRTEFFISSGFRTNDKGYSSTTCNFSLK